MMNLFFDYFECFKDGNLLLNPKIIIFLTEPDKGDHSLSWHAILSD